MCATTDREDEKEEIGCVRLERKVMTGLAPGPNTDVRDFKEREREDDQFNE